MAVFEKVSLFIGNIMKKSLFFTFKIFSVNCLPPDCSYENFKSTPRGSELFSDWLKFTRTWAKPLRRWLFRISIKVWGSWNSGKEVTKNIPISWVCPRWRHFRGGIVTMFMFQSSFLSLGWQIIFLQNRAFCSNWLHVLIYNDHLRGLPYLSTKVCK